MHASQSVSLSENRNKIIILVVDDEALLREAISRQLKREGYELYTAASSDEAYRSVQSHKPELIISDIRMPNGDGISLLRKVKENFHSIPVILMTGGSDTPPSEAFHWGAEAIIKKPFEHETFLAAIKKSLAPYKERWQVLPQSLPNIDISVLFEGSLAEAVKNRDLLVGKGGFALRIAGISITSGSNVTFEVKFKAGRFARLAGGGLLQWKHSAILNSQEQYAGIEINSLTEEAMDLWLGVVNQENPKSYIPLASKLAS